MKLSLKCVRKYTKFLMGQMSKKYPVKISYAISKNYKKLFYEYEITEKCNENLVEKYCMRDEKGEIARDENDNAKFLISEKIKADKEFAEFLETETEVEITTIELSELLKLDSMTAGDFVSLDFMTTDK